jgi:hypothetical protein
MKQSISLLALVCVIGLFTVAQNTKTLVNIKLKNTSLIPKKLTVVSYSPGESGNGAQGFSLMPGSQKELQFAAGTKIYLANNQQTDSVMSGKRIDSGKPFLTIKATDNGKTFKL